jgi:hypothetical protein
LFVFGKTVKMLSCGLLLMAYSLGDGGIQAANAVKLLFTPLFRPDDGGGNYR